MSILRRAAGNLLERRAAEFGSSSIPPPGQAFTTGGFVNETTPLTIVAAMACMSVLADAVSTLPMGQFVDRRDGQVEQIETSPLIADPYAEITRQDWVTQEMMSMLMAGNGLGQIIDRDRLGYATQIKPVARRNVKASRAADGSLEYRFHNRPVPYSDVFHMRAISLPEGLMGLSPLENMRRTFGLGIAAENYAASFYANTTNPGGVLQAESGLSEEDVEIIARQWMAAHGGTGKAGLPAVLSGVKWEQTSLSAGDALFLDARKMTVDEMVMLYRVPPHMIGSVDRTTSWGAGIEQQEMGFVRNTLLSWCSRFENALNPLLPPGEHVRFDFSKRLRGDTLQRAQAAVLARNGGWMNADECRQLFDMAPIPGGLGQDYLQPLNYVAVGSAAAGAVAESGKQPDPAVPSPTPPE